MNDKKMMEKIFLDQKIQMEALEQLCMNRKRQNFDELKKWDQNRAQKLIVHRRVSEEIVQSLQKKLMDSNHYFNIVTQYLNDLLQQKKRYQEQIITDPNPKLSQNLVGKTVHMTTSRALNKLYAHSQNQLNLKPIIQTLQKSLKELHSIIDQSEKDIMEIRTKLQLTIIQIQDQNLQAAELCENLMSNYNKDKNSKNFKIENDFFLAQQIFIRQALKQIEAQKVYGNEVVNYIEYMQKLQNKKIECLRKILNQYINYIFCSDHQTLESLKLILNPTNESESVSNNSVFCVEEMLEGELITSICKVQERSEKEKVQMKFVKIFLKRLQNPTFQNFNLILKLYKVFIKTQQQLDQAIIILTVDAFMNISGGHQTHTLPLSFDYSFKLDSSLTFDQQGDISLIVSSQKRQLSNFLTKKVEKQLEIVFSTTDARDQFYEFVRKFIK